MRKHRIALTLLLLLSLASLSACAYANYNPSPSNASPSDASTNPTDESVDSGGFAETEETASARDDERLYEKCVQIDELPPSDIVTEDSYVFDDRTLLLEDTVENELERLIFDYYYARSAGDFEKIYNLNGETEYLRIATKNEENAFNEGVYMSEYILHELAVLTVEDLQELPDSSKEDLLEKIDTFQFDQYAIVQVDVSMKYNEAWLDRSPQLEEGRYLRCYLFATTADVPEFKIYELYWGELFLATD